MVKVNKTEDFNAYMRSWYRVNKKMKQCECGCIIVASGYSGHLKTYKHRYCMENKSETNVADEIERMEMFIQKLKVIESTKIDANKLITTI